MASLIRRTKSNLSIRPGTSMSSVLSSPIKKNTIPLASLTNVSVVNRSQTTVAPGAGGGGITIPTAIAREDTSVFVPTQAQKSVITPQQVISGQVVQIERVSVTNAQEGLISVEYSTPTPKAPTITAPIVRTVTSSSQATALSNILGRNIQTGQGLTQADVRRINAPRASTGFTGGRGFGQAFPVNEQLFKLGQAAVSQSRAFSLALKAGFSVSLPGRGQQARTISFGKIR